MQLKLKLKIEYTFFIEENFSPKEIGPDLYFCISLMLEMDKNRPDLRELLVLYKKLCII